ncbi:MAG TPA: hypothetical protein VGU64_14380 [Terriglobales bacterium]|nr:hypothetical protein [Terriglobales bacterium]
MLAITLVNERKDKPRLRLHTLHLSKCVEEASEEAAKRDRKLKVAGVRDVATVMEKLWPDQGKFLLTSRPNN